MVQEDPSNLITNGLCVSIAVRLKWLRASVSTCPLQIQHAKFKTNELHPSAKERPPSGLKGDGRRIQHCSSVGNSRVSNNVGYVDHQRLEVKRACNSRVTILNTSTIPLI